jgi:sulfide:quinone oxidoreductase
VFKNDATGETVERLYNHFYSLLPTTTHSNLKDAGLADSTGYLDVDPYTLQHKKYRNIFGLGDVINVPTTKSFYGGLNQVAVVRNNVERKLNGLSLNAKYDGYAKVKLSISPSANANIEHKYGGEEISFSTDTLSSSLRYKLYTLFGKHGHEEIVKFKSWGPPNYKFKKSFEATRDAVAPAVPASLHPDKKTA